MDDHAEDERQITCKLTSKLPSPYRVPPEPLALPSSLTRLGLSQVVNHLLALEEPHPFDFLINGALLRQPLGAFLREHEISAEATLTIEYIPAIKPPQSSHAEPHDDWVAAVAVVDGADAPGSGRRSNPHVIVSGAYDGIVRTWSYGAGVAGRCLAAHTSHDGPVSGVCVHGGGGVGSFVVSAGKDGRLVGHGMDSHGVLSAQVAYEGHADAVDCVAASPGGESVVSGGWDGAVRVWAAPERAARDAERQDGDDAEDEAPKKKKKRSGRNGAGDAALPVLRSHQALEKHSQCVSGVAWASPSSLVSCSWDHAARIWDAETGACVDTLNGAKALFSVSVAEDGRAVALAGADKAWRLWDPRARSPDGSVVLKAFHSHKAWVAGIAFCAQSPHHLATASHDGTVKIWDLRAVVPLATVEAHEDKALCVAWLGGSAVVSGGADCRLAIHEVGLAGALGDTGG
ncbi:unnamed protein product [Pedinophyceae sp. YPF-701]|nr:unnamed protein product [Pedinophyceae sp. YPF-701]